MPAFSEEIETKLALLPEQPGVYLWKDKDGTIIYIGKALNLKHRIKNYLNPAGKDLKTEHLIKNIADLDYIITNSEADAFILEATLVKRYRPKYNIMLKDDKRYPFVKITVNEPFPRIFITRELLKDNAKYFGPYTEVRYLRNTLRDLEWIFPLRSCNRNIPKIKYKQPCMNFQLGKCPAPCIGNISQKNYAKTVNQLLRFFNGRYTELLDELRTEMQNASAELRFEEAGKFRDRIIAIERIQKRQSVFNVEGGNIDIIGFYREEKRAVCVILKMKNGAIIHQENYPLTNLDYEEPDSILASFLQLYYADREEMPEEVLLPFAPKDMDKLNSWLGNKLQIPQRGEKTKLIAMAKTNAFNIVEESKLAHLRKANRTIFPVQELKEALKLPKLPRKIVCMDISTIQGSDTVSSAVFFENGKSKKKYYRHFIIRSIETQNDYAAMQETMARFLTETEKEPQMKPDLIVIDGGKGQLSASEQILRASGKNDISIIALAKRAEEVFVPGNEQSIILPRSSSALRLLINIRDEAHRFALSLHRKRRSRRTLESELESISGIGEKNKFLLLKELGSVENIANANRETLSKIKGIGPKIAEKIYNHFHST
ncbi:excinuclease ABC subunit UvrC [Candidatus Cloacimonas acidaminovorans]|uniref:UvrABC system protein C n=1 Tax=Cloacimonas acidaminovorans (strain Evry) TaxID=459349 RepID=B0VH58_CLOAI|nr:excinuclease ABC subunit UvrC [Candidatus Cloacimonas acidaminovorans]CAO80673.1 Excinuclease ABC, C subunit [Candidatus Cloacimonas acidaminovorans str. Evry]